MTETEAKSDILFRKADKWQQSTHCGRPRHIADRDTTPEQIASDKAPYYKALEKADDSWKREIVALSGMDAMLDRMLKRQLEDANGGRDRDG